MIRLAATGAALLASLLALGTLESQRPILLWNTTASAPLGLYGLSCCRALMVGEWVAARPSGRWAGWLEREGYLPNHVPLLKRVAAVEGQQVCRYRAEVVVGGRLAARAKARSRRGGLLPVWRGCRTLGPGEIFLLNAPEDSLDGRYLGVSEVDDLVGRARPLWTWGGP